MNEEFGVTEDLVTGHNYWWDTLTAPSFGKTHDVRKKGLDPVRCSCGSIHSHDDPLKGVPVGRYDRKAAVEWNMASSDLIRKSFERLSKHVPELEYAAVKEFQARGAIHLHYLARTPSHVDPAHVWEHMGEFKNTSVRGFKWGQQTASPELIVGSRMDNVRYLSKLVGYTAKGQGRWDRVSPERMRHYDLMTNWSTKLPHNKTCDPATCLSTAHRNLGHRGHVLTVSKNWSLVGLDRKQLRAKRLQWVQENWIGQDEQVRTTFGELPKQRLVIAS